MQDADPFDHFQAWMTEAEPAEPNEPNAMTLATADRDGRPSARIVLLKGVDPAGADQRGFVFYTNNQSRKAGELAANARVALLFHWKSLGRQIRIEGRVQPARATEADAYFASRARISRLGAWASDQSRPLGTRVELEQRLAETRPAFPATTFPGRRTGPATAWCPTASSSGRTCRSGCTIAPPTRRVRMAAGRSASCSREPTGSGGPPDTLHPAAGTRTLVHPLAGSILVWITQDGSVGRARNQLGD